MHGAVLSQLTFARFLPLMLLLLPAVLWWFPIYRVASGGADVQLLNGTSYGCVHANIVVGCARANKVVRYHSRMVQMFDSFRIHTYILLYRMTEIMTTKEAVLATPRL